jgi:hypothetical protein
MTLLFTACDSDEKITDEGVSDELLTSAKNYLTGDIILSTKATMSGVDKTLLPQGCPTKFGFKWSTTDKNTFNISLLNFSVGAMPLTVNFRCDVKVMQLNTWEKDTYKGDGWIKFKGEDGETFSEDSDSSSTEAEGSSVTGYYNTNTHEINFIVDYNMMNVRSECFLQTIDKNRINNYEAEFEQYEKDLAEYKKEHGL